MKRAHLAELVTIIAGVATLISGAWSFYCPTPKNSVRFDGFGIHSLLQEELVGKMELSDQQIDEIAAVKIKSIQDLRPMVHQLLKDVRQLKALKSTPNYDGVTVKDIEQRIIQDKELIIKHNLEDHQTMSRILGS